MLAGRFAELAWPMGGVHWQYKMGVAFQELLCIPPNNVFFLNSLTKGYKLNDLFLTSVILEIYLDFSFSLSL